MGRWLALTVAVLVFSFGIVLTHLQRESLWFDEAWTAWAIYYNPTEITGQRNSIQSPREILAFLRDDTLNAFNNVRRDDVHPPLYYLLLNTWSLVMGESVFALRVYSALWGMLALAGVVAWGKSIANWRVGIVAGLLLGVSAFFLYYSREARMYTQFLALSVLMAALAERYAKQKTRWRGVLLGLVMCLLVLTHYVGLLLVAMQAIFLLIRVRSWRQLLTTFAPFVLAAAMFALWLPFALTQFRERGQSAALALPSDLSTVLALGFQLSANHFLFVILLLIAGIIATQRRGRIIWVLLWGIVPVVILFVVNFYYPIFQLRYVIFLWGAMAVAVARAVVELSKHTGRYRDVVLIALVGVFAFVLLSDAQWLPKSNWRDGVAHAATARSSEEPALVSYLASSPVAYYDRITPLRKGINLDIGWRQMTPAEIAERVRVLQNDDAIWLIAQASDPAAWDALSILLSQGYTQITYSDSVNGMLFYRLDKAQQGRELALYWQMGDGDILRQAPVFDQQITSVSAEQVCFETGITQSIQSNAQIAIVEGYNTVLHSETVPLTETACMTLPTLNGRYQVRFSIPDALLLENFNAPLYWGNFVVLGEIVIEG